MNYDQETWKRLYDRSARSEMLWHYTDWAGLDGILTANVLWASHNAYLNDAQEQRDALIFFRDTFAKTELNNVKGRIEYHLENPGYGTFVVSLTTRFDALGQWRAYTGRSVGFSIGFNRERLEKIAQSWGFNLVKCLYQRAEKEGRLGDLVDRLSAMVKENIRIDNDPSYSEMDRYLAAKGVDRVQEGTFEETLLGMAPEFKDEAFKEEEEVRLVSGADGENNARRDNRLGFHLKGSVVVPHINIPLVAREGSIHQPIDAILVGPSPHPHLLVQAVARRVLSFSSRIIGSIASTRVPFRNW